MVNTLGLIGLIILVVHFAVPLSYYIYAKLTWYNKRWSLRIREDYKPKVSIIIPTFNEANIIEQRLDNIYSQDYPRSLVEVVIVDSASTDGTPERVADWARRHGDLRVKIIAESERRGKAHALNNALGYVEGEVVVLADADAFWDRKALSKAVKWLSSPDVGAVSCVKIPLKKGLLEVEKGYRDFYNILRIAESKAYSTPIFHGELAAFKTELLRSLGGFPVDIGADDSHMATLIALNGYRAIIPEDIITYETIPSKGYFKWRVRRAQHLIQHFTRTLKHWRRNSLFKNILITEIYLHVFNPWLLPLSTALLLASAVISGDIIPLILIAIGLALLLYKPYRTWIITQLILITAMIRNIVTKELVWEKHTK